MAVGTTLEEMVEMLRAETGRSMKVNVGVDDAQALRSILRREQEMLHRTHFWPHLRTLPTTVLSAGQRFYDWPATLDSNRVEQVSFWYSGHPVPLERGVGLDEYGCHDSESDERADPAQRWDTRWAGTATQVEVWPIPATAGKLQWMGSRPLRPLIADSDRADLDDHLIVLHAAVKLVARQEGADVRVVQAQAAACLSDLRAAAAGGSRTFSYGGNPEERRYRPTVIRVR